MVRQNSTVYKVKRRGKTFEITKEDLKKRNLEIVAEFKGADKDRRGELLGEYYDLNKPFINYFPQFHGDYREEIINTFIGMIPEFFDNFNPERGVDVNSFLSMFCKKHAVREFLYLHSTVMYNKFQKGPNGRQEVIKAKIISLDGMSINGGQFGEGESGDHEGSGYHQDRILGESIFEEFLQGNRDGAEEFLDSQQSYSRYFEGQPAEIVKDFESGMRWHEVMERSGLTTDRFLSNMSAIRLQLQRILKYEGKDARFITKQERSERRKSDVAAENKRAASSGVPHPGGDAKSLDRILSVFDRVDEADGEGAESERSKSTGFDKGIWAYLEGEEE